MQNKSFVKSFCTKYCKMSSMYVDTDNDREVLFFNIHLGTFCNTWYRSYN